MAQPPLYTTLPNNNSEALQAQSDPSDDFKYGTVVAQCTSDIRLSFIRKVYALLTAQLSVTVVTVILMNSYAKQWIQTSPITLPLFYTSLVVTFVSLIGLMFVRHRHPWNLVLMSLFTLAESYSLSIVVSFYDAQIVLYAFALTLVTFFVLTLVTFITKVDAYRWAPFLTGALIILLVAGVIQLFFPPSRTADLWFGALGSFLFAVFLVFDTSLIMHRLHPEEYILGAMDLYLDLINLFLYLLRFLAALNRTD